MVMMLEDDPPDSSTIYSINGTFSTGRHMRSLEGEADEEERTRCWQPTRLHEQKRRATRTDFCPWSKVDSSVAQVSLCAKPSLACSHINQGMMLPWMKPLWLQSSTAWGACRLSMQCIQMAADGQGKVIMSCSKCSYACKMRPATAMKFVGPFLGGRYRIQIKLFWELTLKECRNGQFKTSFRS